MLVIAAETLKLVRMKDKIQITIAVLLVFAGVAAFYWLADKPTIARVQQLVAHRLDAVTKSIDPARGEGLTHQLSQARVVRGILAQHVAAQGHAQQLRQPAQHGPYVPREAVVPGHRDHVVVARDHPAPPDERH